MSYSLARLSAITIPAAQSILDWRNNAHFRLPGDSRPSVLLQVPQQGLSIGTKDADLLLSESSGRGWIARRHCVLYGSGSGILLENCAASSIQYATISADTLRQLAKDDQGALPPGSYSLHLADDWEFELVILSSCKAQGQLVRFSECETQPRRCPSVHASGSSRRALKRAEPSPSPVRSSALLKGERGISIPPPQTQIVLHRTKATQVRLVRFGDQALVQKECMDKSMANAWISEVNVLKRIQHKNIISIVEFRKKPLPLITTRFVGPDLSAFQDSKRLSTFNKGQQDVIEDDMCGALVYLKRHGIVHRDIKPRNVLFSEYEHKAVLIDFGLACMEGECDNKGDYGTPCFLPPEASTGAQRSYEGDVWATGVVLLFVRKYITGEFNGWNLKRDSIDHFAKHNEWVQIVKDQRRMLPKGSKMRAMLEPKPSKRTTAETLFEKAIALHT